MRRTMKKIIRYLALAALIVGLIGIAYGAIVNQVALNTFLTLLNQGGFKAFVVGILLVVAALILLVMSFFIGRGKPERPAAAEARPQPQPQPQAQQDAVPSEAPMEAPYEPYRQ